MLKLIYTEADLYLELVNADRQDWMTQWLGFGIGCEHLSIERGRAFFPLPERLCEIAILDFYLRCDLVETLTIEPCEPDYVEIGLTGYWILAGVDTAEGIFVTQLPDRIESYLCRLYASTKESPIDRGLNELRGLH
jgi:hypothetical protein